MSRLLSRLLRGALFRLTAIAGGCVLGLVLLEILLQLGGAVVRVSTRREWRPDQAASARRVLAVGDSNTYGLYVREEQAYPRVLERLWNARRGRPPVEVVNLGYPGSNSANFVAALPRLLPALRPDVVTVMLGANDFWTTPSAQVAGDGVSLLARLRAGSRVYRLLYMLGRQTQTAAMRGRLASPWDGLAPDEVARRISDGAGTLHDEATVEVGGERIGWAWAAGAGEREWLGRLRENLARVVALVRAHGAEPVFVTYPAADVVYANASGALREVAQRQGVMLIDPAPIFARHCPRPCQTHFFADHHPTARGHHAVARLLLRQMWRDISRSRPSDTRSDPTPALAGGADAQSRPKR